MEKRHDPGASEQQADTPDPTGSADGLEGSRKQSQVISRVLTPAVRLWLRSQLDHVEELALSIEAGDRQLLSGAISRVSAAAAKAVYQGVHLSQIQVTSHTIQTNLRQMLRGKPFRLLAAFPVAGTVTLSEADLNASLQSPLLAHAITDFLLSLVQPEAKDTERSATLQDTHIELGEGELIFKGLLMHQSQPQPILIRTALTVEKGNLLKLSRFELQMDSSDPTQTSPKWPSRFTFNLGSDVQLEELAIRNGQLMCRGQVRVTP